MRFRRHGHNPKQGDRAARHAVQALIHVADQKAPFVRGIGGELTGKDRGTLARTDGDGIATGDVLVTPEQLPPARGGVVEVKRHAVARALHGVPAIPARFALHEVALRALGHQIKPLG